MLIRCSPVSDMQSTAGTAKGKAESKQAPAKAPPKPAPAKAQKPEPPKQAAAPSKDKVNGSAVQRGPERVTTAFGNVPRSAAPDAPQSSSHSAAQQPLPPSKAPPLAPASEVKLGLLSVVLPPRRPFRCFTLSCWSTTPSSAFSSMGAGWRIVWPEACWSWCGQQMDLYCLLGSQVLKWICLGEAGAARAGCSNG